TAAEPRQSRSPAILDFGFWIVDGSAPNPKSKIQNLKSDERYLTVTLERILSSSLAVIIFLETSLSTLASGRALTILAAGALPIPGTWRRSFSLAVLRLTTLLPSFSFLLGAFWLAGGF